MTTPLVVTGDDRHVEREAHLDGRPVYVATLQHVGALLDSGFVIGVRDDGEIVAPGLPVAAREYLAVSPLETKAALDWWTTGDGDVQ
jgi:hypothetical protein